MGGQGSGGYQQPSNPAPVSGPGELAQRTDGGAIDGMSQPQREWTGLPYGENKAVNDAQSAAPMASGMPVINAVPLSAPSERPDEPLTAGINRGDGAGSEAMRGLLPNRAPSLVDTIKHLAQFDPSGDAELIYRTLTDQGY